MFVADTANIAANLILILLFVRLIQTHFAANTTLGSALAFLFH